MDTVARWHVEHGNIERLLDFLGAEHSHFSSGARPDYDLMLNVVGYLNYFPDRYHCSREDVAFGFLALNDPEMVAKTDRLLQDHREIANLAERLYSLLLRLANGDGAHRVQIEAALATYLVRHRQHITVEEEEVLPRAAELLTPEQWQSVADAAPPCPEPFRSYHRRRHNPTFGSEAEIRYRELSRRISMWHSIQPDPLPARSFESNSPDIREHEKGFTEAWVPVRRETFASRGVRTWRLLARQAAILLALVLSYLQYYFLDVDLKIFRLPALIVYLFR